MGVNIKHRMAFAALAVFASLPVQVAADPGKARVEWDKLSVEQQKSLKAGSPQTKQVASQSSHVYVDGVRKSVVVEGTGPQAVFRVEGMASTLRHSGRAQVQTKSPQTQAAMTVLLEGTGLSALRPLDEAGTLWSVQGAAGLEGVQAINRLQESGKVAQASPDWQRDLKTK